MSKRGQSTIEYVLIAVLVILGVVYMGPYVLRSVGAHFKLWDEGAYDSYTEDLQQAPVNDVPNINITCEQCPYTAGSCGSSVAGSQCGPGQRAYNLSCGSGPQGCTTQPASICKLDQSCCSTYYPENCGTVPMPSGGLSGTSCQTGQGFPSSSTCSSSPASAPGNCYYGQRIYETTCSSLPLECVTDTSCNPKCLGVVSESDAQACLNGPPGNGITLTQDYGMTFVGNQSACTAGTPCQFSCKSGYVLNASGVCTLCSPTIPPGLILSTSPYPQYYHYTDSKSCGSISGYQQSGATSSTNYFFFNFFCSSQSPTETVNMATAFPLGQTYHLKLIATTATLKNALSENSCNPSQICDSDIIANNTSYLQIRVGDEIDAGPHTYTWQLLDSNDNPIFEWTGGVDYTMDLVFVPSCAS